MEALDEHGRVRVSSGTMVLAMVVPKRYKAHWQEVARSLRGQQVVVVAKARHGHYNGKTGVALDVQSIQPA